MLNIYSMFYEKIKKGLKLRSKLLVLALMIVFPSVVYAKARAHDYEDMVFINYVDQDLALHEYARLAGASEGKEKERYLRLFFNALPRDFATFFKMTHYRTEEDFQEGFRGNTYYSTTSHGYIYSHNPWGRFHLKLKGNCPLEEIPVLPISGKFPRPKERNGSMFIELPYEVQGVVPTEIYYEKLLSLGVDGFWDADDVNFLGMHINMLVFQDLPLAVKVLEKKSDDEIVSFWYYLYDGPHPEHEQKQAFFKSTSQELMPLSPRIAGLLQRAYDQLLSEKHCPCH